MKEEEGRACHHTFIPRNPCLADRGLHYLGGVYGRKKAKEKSRRNSKERDFSP
jgi:hypothetical protein